MHNPAVGVFLCVSVAERGFINLTEGEDSVVREGESLTLSVEMTSYPKPRDVYWTYNNQQLKNTSEHVITLQNQQYRYTPAHIFYKTTKEYLIDDYLKTPKPVCLFDVFLNQL